MKIKLIAAILPLTVILAGCWDRTEVNDVAFVMGTAIDKEGNKYRTTIQIALPGQLGGAGSQGGGGGSSGGKKWYNQTNKGETFREAIFDAQQSNSRLIDFAHRRVLLFGEELAAEGLEPVIDVLARIPQNRLSAYVLVTKGPADQLLAVDAIVEQNPSEMIRELASAAMRTPRTLKDFVNLMLSQGIDPSAPLIAIDPSIDGLGKQKPKTVPRVSGLAVFRNNKLAGMLKGDEAKALLIAMNQAQRPEFASSPPSGEGKIVVRFEHYETKLRPQIEGDSITMRVEIRLRGFVLENESNYDLHDDAHITKFEQVLVKKVKSDILHGISRVQHEFGSDPLGFGRAIHIQEPKYWKQMSGRWKDVYPQIKVSVVPDVRIENIGSVMPPLGRKDNQLQR